MWQIARSFHVAYNMNVIILLLLLNWLWIEFNFHFLQKPLLCQWQYKAWIHYFSQGRCMCCKRLVINWKNLCVIYVCFSIHKFTRCANCCWFVDFYLDAFSGFEKSFWIKAGNLPITICFLCLQYVTKFIIKIIFIEYVLSYAPLHWLLFLVVK